MRARPPSPTRRGALDRCINLADIEALARRRMSRSHFDYFAGGAEDERAIVRNREAFERLVLLPRVLVDVSQIDLTTEVLGTRVTMPIALAPAAYHRLAHRDGELAVARAAGGIGTLMVVSTLSTCSLEAIAEANRASLWFQLYVFRDRVVSQRLVARAEEAGYRAICLTVDTPRLGQRERDMRGGFRLPPGLTIRNFEGLADHLTRWDRHGSMAAYAREQLDPSLTWKAVEWLQSCTRLPIVLKGILRPDDAVRAVQFGARGIWVSNHGGRQLDAAQSTLDALPTVVAAVANRAEVYVDGGFRRGSDVLKALALGARMVAIGRPYLWGLAAGGERGVRRVLEILQGELELSMALSGCPTIGSIDPSFVANG